MVKLSMLLMLMTLNTINMKFRKIFSIMVGGPTDYNFLVVFAEVVSVAALRAAVILKLLVRLLINISKM